MSEQDRSAYQLLIRGGRARSRSSGKGVSVEALTSDSGKVLESDAGTELESDS